MAKRSKRKKAVSGEVPAKTASIGAVAPQLPSWLGRDWLWGLILVLAVILAYSPVWWAGYIWDDDLRLTANPCIVGPLGLKEIWTTSAADLCPLVYTTFWVEYPLWGLAPLPYHLVNVLLHGLGAVVLWRVLRSLQVPGAWLGATLWALHPVQVESVAWITEMKNTQSGLFFLLSILFFVRGLNARAINRLSGNGWNHGLTLVFAALAMASKSSTVVLPIVLGLCAWWVEGRWRWRNLSVLAPIGLMTILPSLLTLWTQKLLLHGSEDLQYDRSLPERLITAGDAVWFYLGKLLWPHPLIFIYPRWEVDAVYGMSYLPLLATLILLFALWRKRETWSRPYFFAFAYFLGALLPVLGLVDGFFWRYSLVGDHFQYLASMGPLALAGATLTRLADFVIPGKFWMQSSLFVGLLLVLAIGSWQRTWAYESEETLWTVTLAQNPNCWLAQNNLGIILVQKGEIDAAIAQYQRALEINPNLAEVHNNLGNAFIKKGQVREAMGQYQDALLVRPNYADACNDLGYAFLFEGRRDEAMVQYRKALEIDPTDADAHYNLGNAFLQKGQIDGAIEEYQDALMIRSAFVEAHYNLGIALAQKGQMDKAIVQYQKALELKPNYAEAHSNLGLALARKGRVVEAIVEYREALRLKPYDTVTQNNLARAQAMTRQAPSPK